MSVISYYFCLQLNRGTIQPDEPDANRRTRINGNDDDDLSFGAFLFNLKGYIIFPINCGRTNIW